MKIRITLDVSDATRKGISARYGKRGLATRADILTEHAMLWKAFCEDMEHEKQHSTDGKESR